MVPQRDIQRPDLPACFVWRPVYQGIVERSRIDAAQGDIYALAASEAALGAIDRAVRDAWSAHLAKMTTREPPGTQEALQTLRTARSNRKKQRDLSRAQVIQRSLDQIYRLTHALDTELKHRSEEFQSASLPRAIPVPGRQALGRWLLAQVDEAHGTGIVNSYFGRLEQELADGRDPWTASRELMTNLPSPGDKGQAARLQTAHVRLVHAIACRLSARRPESGDPEPPSGFNWLTAYKAIQDCQVTDVGGADIYAAAASTAAVLDIDRAATYAHFTHRLQIGKIPPLDTPETLEKLRGLRASASHSRKPVRATAIQQSLDYIDRLTHARHAELELRSHEFRSVSHVPGAPVPDRPTLERWLRSQADTVQDGGLEHSYFTRLLQELPAGRDPWEVSRELMRILPSPHITGQEARLQAVHRLLVQAMAGSPSQPATVPPPGVARAPHASRVPLSIRQGVLERLNGRNRLSGWQVQNIMSAVKRAIDAGTLSVSTSQPEAWARGLLGRVQASVQRPFDELTEFERIQESTDLLSLRKLVEELGGLGYL